MDTSTNTIFPKGQKAPAEYFTGAAWVKALVFLDTTFNSVIGNVIFEPGARNNWHTHPGGQILLVRMAWGIIRNKASQSGYYAKEMW